MNKGTFATTLLCAAGFLGVALGAPASADPSHGAVPVTLACENGETYQAVFEAGATWNVQQVTTSTQVVVPTALQYNVVVVDADGTLLFEYHSPWTYKGSSSGRPPHEVSCSFDFTVYPGQGHVGHSWGTVFALITPAH
jgi:hypothetical protein